jgi:hypothetical protein
MKITGYSCKKQLKMIDLYMDTMVVLLFIYGKLSLNNTDEEHKFIPS